MSRTSPGATGARKSSQRAVGADQVEQADEEDDGGEEREQRAERDLRGEPHRVVGEKGLEGALEDGDPLPRRQPPRARGTRLISTAGEDNRQSVAEPPPAANTGSERAGSDQRQASAAGGDARRLAQPVAASPPRRARGDRARSRARVSGVRPFRLWPRLQRFACQLRLAEACSGTGGVARLIRLLAQPEQRRRRRLTATSGAARRRAVASASAAVADDPAVSGRRPRRRRARRLPQTPASCLSSRSQLALVHLGVPACSATSCLGADARSPRSAAGVGMAPPSSLRDSAARRAPATRVAGPLRGRRLRAARAPAARRRRSGAA